MEGYKYCHSKYKGRIADDVLSDGAETDDDDVVENLERVARLREWVKHVEFGIDFDTNHSISRVCLGIGQGYTNWVPLYKMAKTLDPSLYITQAKNIHRYKRFFNHINNKNGQENESKNYTIGQFSESIENDHEEIDDDDDDD